MAEHPTNEEDGYWVDADTYTEEEFRAVEILGGFSTTENLARSASLDNVTDDATVPIKRKLGRPKGSGKKKESPRDAVHGVSKRLGRPPGSGHLQRAHAAGTAPLKSPSARVVGPEYTLHRVLRLSA
ncbi:hypothetical protein B0H10DRAFT_1971537 [Mycena sp. CBHHK59/15]|nr:hypothetical protein B0H10DRAFT_1971537 [Mycena sp. CBHHK59/15]